MKVDSPPYLVADWDAATRVLDLRYVEASVLTDAMADETIRFLDAFLQEQGPGIGLLVDGGNVRDASPGYRQALSRWFRANAARTRMAIYNLSPLVRVMTLLFAKATRFPVKIAADREEARRWLTPVLTR